MGLLDHPGAVAGEEPREDRTVRIAIIGGGISGVTAAYRLHSLLPNAEISVIDQARYLGGKIKTGTLAGRSIETGAEAFLCRDPIVVDLAFDLGLQVIHPSAEPAALALGGTLKPIPKGTLVGVPSSREMVAGIAELTPEPVTDGPLLGPESDISVGELVRARYGGEIVDRLVDPLLGGVYAGRADQLSLAATIPALAAKARRYDTLAGAVRAALDSGGSALAGVPGPIFGSIAGGMSVLVNALAEASGARLRLGVAVRELSREGEGWQLVLGATHHPEIVHADAVILAVPARPAARLLARVAPMAAAEIGALDYASIALVSLALPACELPELSGFLVPVSEGYVTKAVTFFDQKWPERATPGMTMLRASVGRYGEEHVLQRSDADLIDLVRTELSALIGTRLPTPMDAAVHRWGGALPQYEVGHLDRVRRARTVLEETQGLALAGAGFDGVGIPACVRSGMRAADALLGVESSAGSGALDAR
ncbi:MAG: protoporphyrinogen oxidase [Longispora sp.]|nr:protoporphyrinogen oxidase [Longispora sp. (in: high G+C Gram-positive bacteria)]